MRVRLSHIPMVAILAAGSVALICGAAFSASSGTPLQAATTAQVAAIKIDYPLDGSVFPPEITPPTFLWHDANETSKRWAFEVSSGGAPATLRINAPGDLLQSGQNDPDAGPDRALTPEQASTHTWKPDVATWDKIKHLSVNSPARITIKGLAADGSEPVSIGQVSISTSPDPVGAPVFYRDVPLRLPPPEEKGPIAPLPRSAIPLIKWQIRDISQPKSHLVMTNLPTCANCHSISRDGTTFGLDLDGPRNDKGLYALVPVSKEMTIRNSNVIHWSSFGLNDETRAADPAVKRFGFMSQVSPDRPLRGHFHRAARTIPTSIKMRSPASLRNPRPHLQHQLPQHPVQPGLLSHARHSRLVRPQGRQDAPAARRRRPGICADQRVLVARWKVPHLQPGTSLAIPIPQAHQSPSNANDPGETQIQYDLYKIPFNEGRGGKAVPVDGASANGMSNNFPKVSPDGKWIVFVQNKNGLLMRPDSKLYIVPFAGGKARLMHCNLCADELLAHLSPNGRWLAFSSKARAPYTQLMLTHIDADGNDTPAIIVDDTTAANRAINIPEFLNLPPGASIDKIDPEATNFYRLFDQAYAQIESSQFPEAIDTLHKAIATNPEDPLSHYVLATALSANDQEKDALTEYRRAVALMPTNPNFLDHLAVSLALNGDSEGAIEQLNKAIAVDPGSVEYRFNVAYVLESRGDFAGAIAPLEKAVALSRGKDWRCLAELAKVYDKTGRSADAIPVARQALDLALKQNNQQVASALQDALDHYEHE